MPPQAKPKLAQDVAKRLRELIQETLEAQSPGQRVKTADFARFCGIPDPSLRNYLSAKSIPGGENLAAIAQATGVSIDWLLTGEGPRYRPGQAAPGHAGTGDTVLVPIFDIEASAGGGAFVDEEAEEQVFSVSKSWIRQNLQINPTALNMIRVRGDSMSPTLEHGDSVLVDRSTNRIDQILEGVYVLRIDGYLRVKRLERLGQRVSVRSDNPNYSSENYDLSTFPDEFAVLGRVIAVLKAM